MVAIIQTDGKDARRIRERREQADFVELMARVRVRVVDGGDAGRDHGESIVIRRGEVDDVAALLKQHAGARYVAVSGGK